MPKLVGILMQVNLKNNKIAHSQLIIPISATTRELRSILGSYVSQKVLEHEAINNYVMNKGWMNPYEDPTKQLESSYNQASSIISQQ